jgi:hypothetical protein
MVEEKHINIAIKLLQQEKNVIYKVFNKPESKDKLDRKIKEMDYCIRLIKALWEQTKQIKLF